jgi:hypothetical protein
VGCHQREGGEPGEAVPAGEPVLPDRALDDRDAGHEQHLYEQQIGGEQAGEAADRGQAVAPTGERRDAAAAHP